MPDLDVLYFLHDILSVDPACCTEVEVTQMTLHCRLSLPIIFSAHGKGLFLIWSDNIVADIRNGTVVFLSTVTVLVP